MLESLNLAFENWLKKLAVLKTCSIEDVSKHICPDEIEERLKHYPALGHSLTQQLIDMQQVKAAAQCCLTLTQQNDAIRFQAFIANDGSQKALSDLIVDFPVSDDEAITRINSFIEFCSKHGYIDPRTDKPDLSSAGQFTSTLLTSVFPKRFVDFRQGRWKDFSKDLGSELFTKKPTTYGKMIVEAGHFAASVCQTDAFKTHWPNGEPLWTISGVCMMMKRLK